MLNMMNMHLVKLFLLPSVFGFGFYGFNSNEPIDGYPEDSLREIIKLKEYTNLLEGAGETYSPPLLKVSEDDISLYIYNNDNITETKVFLNNSQDLTEVSQFNTSLETVFLVHGWSNTWNSTFTYLVGHTILELSNKNIISVDWDIHANELYISAHAAVPQVGRYIGQFVKSFTEAYNYSMDNIHLIGHSLGAHICGFIGKETEGELPTIVGLDPAGPLYFLSSATTRLKKGDAKFVKVIHTGGLLLGASFRIGDADFWPNSGLRQPGCGVDITGSCSHSRSYYYFAESLYHPAFYAKNCTSFLSYEFGWCKQVDSCLMGGDPVDTTLSGQYYLKTASSEPYALGDS